MELSSYSHEWVKIRSTHPHPHTHTHTHTHTHMRSSKIPYTRRSQIPHMRSSQMYHTRSSQIPLMSSSKIPLRKNSHIHRMMILSYSSNEERCIPCMYPTQNPILIENSVATQRAIPIVGKILQRQVNLCSTPAPLLLAVDGQGCKEHDVHVGQVGGVGLVGWGWTILLFIKFDF